MEEKEKIPRKINATKRKDAAIASIIKKAKIEGTRDSSGKFLKAAGDSSLLGKNLSWFERYVEEVGIENLKEMKSIMIEKAKAGHEDFLKFFVDKYLPNTKPDRYMRKQIQDFLSLTDERNYQHNIGALIKAMADGEVDLDDAALILTHLYKGTETFVNKTIEEMQEAIKEIKEPRVN